LVAVGVRVSVPESALMPLQPLLAEQDVVFVLLHERVKD
jgi:hypothetical protein